MLMRKEGTKKNRFQKRATVFLYFYFCFVFKHRSLESLFSSVRHIVKITPEMRILLPALSASSENRISVQNPNSRQGTSITPVPPYWAKHICWELLHFPSILLLGEKEASTKSF